MNLSLLFNGYEPDEIFKPIADLLGKESLISVDAAELVLVFGTIAICMGLMVVFGNWWSR